MNRKLPSLEELRVILYRNIEYVINPDAEYRYETVDHGYGHHSVTLVKNPNWCPCGNGAKGTFHSCGVGGEPSDSGLWKKPDIDT